MIKLGATLSLRQLRQLDLDVQKSLTQVLAFGFSYLRLPVHWNEIEQHQGEYVFNSIERLLAFCDQTGQKVVLTLGVKAPRWPEFYWPSYINDKGRYDEQTQVQLLAFVRESVKRLQVHQTIAYWQVENEPLDPSGPQQAVLSLELLRKEVTVVRDLDQRPIILTAWGNDLIARNHLPQLATFADVLGIDLYQRRYVTSVLGQSLYAGPTDSYDAMKMYLTKQSKPIWITELQAEPWEKDEAGFKAAVTPSLSVNQLRLNYELAQSLQVERIFLWGLEYWLYRQAQGDNQYIHLVQSLLRN